MAFLAVAVLAVAVESPAFAVFTRIASSDANTVSTAVLQPPTGLGVNVACGAGVQFRSAGTGSTDNGSVIVVSGPVGVQSGDVMIAVIGWDEATTIAPPAGWVFIREDLESTYGTRQRVFHRVATGAESPTYTFTATGAPEEAVGVIAAYSGVNTASPIEAHGGQAQSGPLDTLITAPSVTPGTSTGRTLVGFFSTSTAGAITSAPGMTERAEVQVATADGAALELADETIPALLPTGTRVAEQVGGVDDLAIGQAVVLTGASDPTLSTATASWTATSSAFASGYTLRRWNGAVLEQQQAITPGSSESAIDGPLTDGTAYRYEVEAVYENWTSTTAEKFVTPACTSPARPFDCPADPDLRACIRFDADVAGTYADESGYGNTVLHTNGTLVPGVTGPAAYGAPGARYLMTDSASLDLTSAMTVEAWMRLDSQPGSGRAGVVDNDGQYSVILYPTGLRCSDGVDQLPHVPVPTGVWFHMACAWDGSTLTLYIDGMPAATMPSTGTIATTNTDPISVLNSSPVFDEPMDGALDNLRIWHSGRTQAQICADAGLSGC